MIFSLFHVGIPFRRHSGGGFGASAGGYMGSDRWAISARAGVSVGIVGVE